ncbi:MAG: DUF58 domain-containing protein [Phycisphaeraceae bacterium]|nr:MAG: DUF58 domain-containing protein [Phycisphaeraceae bacterium]
MPRTPKADRAEHAEGGLLAPSRRRYEPHGPGILYMLITFFLAVGAVNSQNNLLFFAFGLAIAGLLLSGLVSGPPLMRLTARRISPGPAHVGEPFEIRYVIASGGGWFSAMGLEVRELTDTDGETPGRGSLKPAGLLCLRPGTQRTAISSLTPARRGVHGLTGFAISTTYPFGLLRKTLIFDQRHEWIIAPRRVALREMPWHRAGREGATLSAVTSRRGVSTEFYALRAYVPGDSPRQIAWLPSARVGELVVKENAASAPPKIWIRVDEPDADTPGHLVERGAALVAALAQDATQAGFAVGLTGLGIGSIRPLAGPRQVRAIQSAMALLGGGPTSPIADEEIAQPDRRTLRVHVQYEFSGRAPGTSEFRLSAAELNRWYAGAEVPPEFDPPTPASAPGLLGRFGIRFPIRSVRPAGVTA